MQGNLLYSKEACKLTSEYVIIEGFSSAISLCYSNTVGIKN
jgi:hypothetical protein